MSVESKTKESLKDKLAAVKNAAFDKTAKSTEGGSPSGESAKPVAIAGAEKFVYVTELRKGLDLAFNSGENIILWGPGGHAKSEYTDFFFKEKGIVPFVKTMGAGTNTDSLFGGVDIKELNATGKVNYLVENSFMNHEYVVFEELLDAPDYILEQLKDILTSKTFRQGNHIFPIKTKFIVCCTNKSREEFSKNDSLKALMERFPLEYKVQWNAYNRQTYNALFLSMFGESFPTLSYILEKLAIAQSVVSPRTAIKAARILKMNSMDYSLLDYIADFSGKNRDMVKTELAKYKSVAEVEELMDKTVTLMKKIADTKLDNLENIKQVKQHLRDVDQSAQALKGKKVDDELQKRVNASISSYEAFIIQKGKEIQGATEL